YGLTGSPQAAEDLIQDILLSIWERRSVWMPSHSIKAYLYGAIRNRAHNFRRDRKPSVSVLTLAKALDLDYSIVGRDVVFRRAKP
ncbi:MAG: sigma factor, partial [Rhodothermales bacterium]